MPKHKCKDLVEAVRISAALKDQGAPVHLHGLLISSPDTKGWQKAMKKLVAQEKIRKLSERYNERIQQEELI